MRPLPEPAPESLTLASVLYALGDPVRLELVRRAFANPGLTCAVEGLAVPKSTLMSPLTGAAIQSVSPQEGGLASGISSTARQIGAVLGVAVLGAIVLTRESSGASFEAGLDSAFVTAGAASLLTAVFTGLWLVKAKPAEGLVSAEGLVPETHAQAQTTD
jgi:hypothetical protein